MRFIFLKKKIENYILILFIHDKQVKLLYKSRCGNKNYKIISYNTQHMASSQLLYCNLRVKCLKLWCAAMMKLNYIFFEAEIELYLN